MEKNRRCREQSGADMGGGDEKPLKCTEWLRGWGTKTERYRETDGEKDGERLGE